MKVSRLLALLCALILAQAAFANEEPVEDEASQLRGIVKNLMDDNSAFVKSHKPDYYKPFAEKQHPRATVVTCSDSRVHTHALDKTPDGDLFMVRDIGNQISTAEGSVEYGVHHLHTPLLIIVGHVACGAIKAAASDYSKESPAIKRELDTIKLPAKNPKNEEGEEWLRGVDANVNNQVTYAVKKFEEEVKSGKLTVIGAIYDFQNALHQGQGRLVITNINGNTDTGNIMSGLIKITGASAAIEKKPGVKAIEKSPATTDKHAH
jgi:carbonic anhydrase